METRLAAHELMRRRIPGSLSALLVIAAAVSPHAWATKSDEKIDACEDRCEEHREACESKAEAIADECSRKIESDPVWSECGCEEPIDGKRSDKCQKVCTKAGKAAQKCEAKLEKALDLCEEREDTCADKCDR